MNDVSLLSHHLLPKSRQCCSAAATITATTTTMTITTGLL